MVTGGNVVERKAPPNELSRKIAPTKKELFCLDFSAVRHTGESVATKTNALSPLPAPPSLLAALDLVTA